ncbi:MAG: transcriptional regulator [Pseudomonadota bacterium]|nr:transcriptional regulator [Pseudomonadota bacterium]HWL63134.1 transcriptional regulator [Steroidobacteraceae bacterium]
MDGPDEVIHQSMRLRIAAALNALGAREKLEFGQLKAMLEATDGNLATHLGVLEKASYVEIEKDFVGKKPRTRVALTAKGRKALRAHVAYLREVLDGMAE